MTTKVKHIANNIVTDSQIDLSTIDSGEIAEGSNLYFTDARVDSRLSGGSVGNIASSGSITAQQIITGQKLVSSEGILELDDNGTHNGIINVPASLRINIDSDNNNTGESFQVAANVTNISGSGILFKVEENGNATFSNNLTVLGKLNIQGDIDSYNVTDLDVTDKTITLGSGQIEANSGGSGIIVDGSNASLLWNETDNEFVFNKNIKSGAIQLTTDTVSYTQDANISYYSSTNAVYVNGAGANGWLRLNASGVNNDRTAINLFGLNQGDFMTFRTNSNTRMQIQSSGRVGIGHTSPNARLHINAGNNSSVTIGDQTNPALQIGGTTNYRFGVYTDGETAYIENKNGDDGIAFRVKTAGEVMRVEGVSGDWMVGNTVSRVASFYNNQAGCGWRESDHHFEIATTNNRSALEVGRNNANSGDVITIRQQGTSVGMIGTEGGDSLVIQSNGSTGVGLRFHPTTGNIDPVRNGVRIDNTVSLGTGTHRFKDLILSGVIQSGLITSSVSSALEYSTTETSENNTVGSDALALLNTENSSTNGKVSIFMKNTGGGGAATGRITLKNNRSGSSGFGFFLRDNGHTSEQQEKMFLDSDGNITSSGNITSNGNITAGNNGNINIPTASSGNANLSFDGSNFTIVSNSSSANLKLQTYSQDTLTVAANGNLTQHRGTSNFSGLATLSSGTYIGDNDVYQDTGDNFYGGLVIETPIYKEYQYAWSGLNDHETNVYVPSYFMSEIVFTQHQTNGGTDINRHFVGKFANNHTHHELETIHDSGSTWSMTTTMTATDHNLATGGGSGAHGRLRIVETYGSGSYSKSTLTIRVYFGSISNITHTYG